MREEAADAVGLLAGKTATYGGGASALVFGLNANEVAAVIGAIVAVVGLCVQVMYNRRRDRREREHHCREAEYHTARLERLRGPREG